MRPRHSGSDPVHGARELLTVALATLQRIPDSPLDLRETLDHVAAATSAIYAAEAEASSEAEAVLHLRRALDELTRALDLLHSRPAFVSGLDTIATSVAQALALLYPRVRASERRQRGGVSLAPAPPSRRAAAAVPHTELLGERRVAERVGEQRVAGQRVMIEVDVGVLSDSNFYAGVTADVSAGGVFVGTAEPLAVGTEVTLYFTLDDDTPVAAEGSVRWIRQGPEQPLGMGVAFSRLSDDDRRRIAAYCANRPPLYHD